MFCLPNLVDLIVIGVLWSRVLKKSILGCHVVPCSEFYVYDFCYKHSS
jgi:hypothetical protein